MLKGINPGDPDWRFHVAVQLNDHTLRVALSEATAIGKVPCRLVCGKFDRASLDRWFGSSPVLEKETLYVPIVESLRISSEGSRDLVLEIIVGDFPDDGRWYLEDHDGFKIGSIGC